MDRIEELERLMDLLCKRADLCTKCRAGFYTCTGIALYPPQKKCDNCKSHKPEPEPEPRLGLGLEHEPVTINRPNRPNKP